MLGKEKESNTGQSSWAMSTKSEKEMVEMYPTLSQICS